MELTLLVLCFVSVSLSIIALVLGRRWYLDVRRARDLTGDVAELTDSLAALAGSVKRLHSRAGMREIRAARAGEDLESPTREGRCPDWRKDPQGWLDFQQRAIVAKRSTNFSGG